MFGEEPRLLVPSGEMLMASESYIICLTERLESEGEGDIEGHLNKKDTFISKCK